MLKISERSNDYLIFEHDCEEKGPVEIVRIEKDELGGNWEMKYYCRGCKESEEYKIQISEIIIPEKDKNGIPLDGSAKLNGKRKFDGSEGGEFDPTKF